MNVTNVKYEANLAGSANKVFIIGEYGWNDPMSCLQEFVNYIEENTNVSGDTAWSLFGHLDTYGFEQHNDGFTIHYPGDNSTMWNAVQIIRNHCYNMSNNQVPANSIPPAPLITYLKANSIAWRGAYAAVNYTVQTSTSNNGPWNTICNRCANDNQTPWNSTSIVPNSYFRVTGFNMNGVNGPYSSIQQCP